MCCFFFLWYYENTKQSSEPCLKEIMIDFAVAASHKETKELAVQSQGCLCISDSSSSKRTAVLSLQCLAGLFLGKKGCCSLMAIFSPYQMKQLKTSGLCESTWGEYLDGRTHLSLRRSLLPSFCLFEETNQLSVRLVALRVMLSEKTNWKGFVAAALSFLDIRWDHGTNKQEQGQVSWRRLKGLQEL